ncbi:hypothetical protein SASPL_115030 [Salvia splendens]|uniref:PRONE domain-containing protein n=1 Tax=Salvia splendens TaxID=180675 RepID=A0A8X8Y5U7_SALSN|nr:hypothetical protein SASPL_115030 [Salvia splendens]
MHGLHKQKLKAALAINGNVVAEMDILAAYIKTLPKMKQHLNDPKSKRKSWGGKVKGFVANRERNMFLKTLWHSLRLRFPAFHKLP